MLVYFAAPYSGHADKEQLMLDFMTISGRYMLTYPGQHAVSPLFNHYSLKHVPEMGSDWEFWKQYSTDLIRRCDKLVVVQFEGWDTSKGVDGEIQLAQFLGIPIVYVRPENYLHE